VTLTAAQADRAAGVLLGQACGDALGVPYEFGSPPAAGEPAEMSGGGLGNFAPGEWSDDTRDAVRTVLPGARGRGALWAAVDEVAAVAELARSRTKEGQDRIGTIATQ
jgi:ADP-ribosylglycohydrolase